MPNVSTNFIAQASVPGDILYPIKLTFEKAELALAFTPTSESRVHLRHIDKRLREFSLGDYEGKNSKKLTEEEDAFLKSCWDDYTLRVPNGETVNEFIQRIKGIFNEIIAAAEDDSTILIVGHGGTLYHILQSILNILPKNQAWFINCAVTEIKQTQKDKKWTLVKYNDKEIQ